MTREPGSWRRMLDLDTEALFASWRELVARGEPIEVGLSQARGRLEVAGAAVVIVVVVWAMVAHGITSAGLFGLGAAVVGAGGVRRLRSTEPAVVMNEAGVWSAAVELLVPWDVIAEARSAGNPSVVLMVDKAWAAANIGHLSSMRRFAIQTAKGDHAGLALPRHLEVPDAELGVWITARAREGGLR